MKAYYNEFNPDAASVLRRLIKDGFIADGEVDTRSITEVQASDLKGFTQCHFFAGIGGWSIALRKAGIRDNVPIWTGSCPCQPFSTAGNKKGKEDERHLWPVWFRLIRECRPPSIFGEQVGKAIKYGWLDEVADSLEGENYAFGSALLSSEIYGGDHQRERLWFVAHATMHDDKGVRLEIQGEDEQKTSERQKKWLSEFGGANGTKRIVLSDGIARRIPDVEPQICLLADELPRQNRVEHLIGNAIDIEIASRFILSAL